jgi:arginyl-tRNA--protein-N-Asp/Glu arginylyltransferase
MYSPVEYQFLEQPLQNFELDDMLAVGYFRTGNYLLKTRVLLYNENLFNLFHIRYEMETYEFPKSMKKLLNKNNKRFYSKIQPFKNSTEKENLYAQHRNRFVGSKTATLEQYLFDFDESRKFNTYEINLYDIQTEKLVAYSIFDLGSDSMASIIAIFNQDYSAYSLGMYTMLLEIEYAKSLKLKYYYPGYIADKPSPFNYKIRLGKNVSYFDWFTHVWKPLIDIENIYTINDYYEENLNKAEKWLIANNISYRRTRHTYYYMKYYYPQSNCLSSIEQLFIEDFSIADTYFIVEYNAQLDKIVVSAVSLHYLEETYSITFEDALKDNIWQNLLLYIYPNYYVENQQELLNAYIQIKHTLLNKKNTQEA